MALVKIGLVVLGLLFLYWIHVRQATEHFTHYLFFIRYPIGLATLLVLAPFLLPALAPESLHNLFVLDPWGIGVATMLAAIAAWSIVYTGRLIWFSAPDRYKLLLDRGEHMSWEARGRPARPVPRELISNSGAAFSLLLVVPLVGALVYERPPGQRLPGLLAAALGLIVAGGIRQLSVRLGAGDGRLDGIEARLRRMTDGGHLERLAVLPLIAYLELSPETKRLHRRAAAYAVVAFLVYVAGAVAGYPTRPTEWLPPLSYLILLLTVTTWVVGYLSFQFDLTRVPGIPFMIAVLFVWQVLWPSGHVYRVEHWCGAPPPTATEVLQDRGRALGDGTMVVVAASGGGITASLWAAAVLDGLGAEAGFERSVALISAVSGGAVGSMLYVDHFDGAGASSSLSDRSLVAKARHSSLSQVAWGFVYPDLARLVAGRALGRYDRGWAIEQAWRRQLDDRDATLASWADDVRSLRKPLLVFNVTLQETGERLLIASATLPDDPEGVRKRRDFHKWLDDQDVAVVTAARLSATFPYVSPLAKPDVPRTLASRAFHAADGGYFDNSGVVTVLEVLDDYLAAGGEHPRRIALIRIQAGADPVTESPDRAPRQGNLIDALFGPAETLYNVRSTLQVSRAHLEIEQFKRRWKEDHEVEFEPFQFKLSVALPFSWHLTDDEAARILRHWPTSAVELRADVSPGVKARIEAARRENGEVLAKLRTFLHGNDSAGLP